MAFDNGAGRFAPGQLVRLKLRNGTAGQDSYRIVRAYGANGYAVTYNGPGNYPERHYDGTMLLPEPAKLSMHWYSVSTPISTVEHLLPSDSARFTPAQRQRYAQLTALLGRDRAAAIHISKNRHKLIDET